MKNKINIKIIILLTIVLFLLFFAVFQLFPIFQAKKIAERLEETKIINLSGRTLFISDLHLRTVSDITSSFDVDNLIVVGDLFHSSGYFWQIGDTEEEIFSKVFNKLLEENSTTDVYYIISEYTHDPRLQSVDLKINDAHLHIIGKYGRFVLGSQQIIAMHGDQNNEAGIIPGVISYVFKYLGSPLILENNWKNLLGLDEKEWLIMGHSHIPGINYDAKVANAGSWTGAPILNIQTKTGVLFEAGQATFISY